MIHKPHARTRTHTASCLLPQQKYPAEQKTSKQDTLASSRRNSLKNSPSFPNRNRNASLASFGDGDDKAPPPDPPPAADDARAAAAALADAAAADVGGVDEARAGPVTVSPFAWNDSRA